MTATPPTQDQMIEQVSRQAPVMQWSFIDACIYESRTRSQAAHSIVNLKRNKPAIIEGLMNLQYAELDIAAAIKDLLNPYAPRPLLVEHVERLTSWRPLVLQATQADLLKQRLQFESDLIAQAYKEKARLTNDPPHPPLNAGLHRTQFTPYKDDPPCQKNHNLIRSPCA